MNMMSDNMRGAAVTVGCFGSWAVNDALMKLVMLNLPELQAVCLRGLFVVPLLAQVAFRGLQKLRGTHLRVRKRGVSGVV